jgi:hypothetical protein
MSHTKSPYLKNDQRLANVIAAIQSMASNEFYEKGSEEWAKILPGERDVKLWEDVFNDHTEFFRSAERDVNNANGVKTRVKFYSLVARRSFPHFNKTNDKTIYNAEYNDLKKGLTNKERTKIFGRRQLPDGQIKVLIDVAISLHTKAVEAERDWRWSFAPVAASISSLVAAIFAFIAAWQFHK